MFISRLFTSLAAISIASVVFVMSQTRPILGNSDEEPQEPTQATVTPERPTLPEEAAKRVGELEARIEELEKAGHDNDLAEAIEIAEEVLAIRLEHQGPHSGWTNADGEPAEWYKTSDARSTVESLNHRLSLSPEERAEQEAADANGAKFVELFGQGHYVEATAVTKRRLEYCRRTLGNDHPDTLDSINSMGVLLTVQGKYAEAEPVLREALEGNQRVLGDEHPETLLLLENIGSLAWYQGKWNEAEQFLRQAQKGLQRILGDDHPSTLQVIDKIGSVLHSQGRLPEAEQLFREALAGRRRALGNEDLGTLHSINNLALLFEHQGKLHEAESLHREATEIFRRTLGEDHPHTLTSINNLAVVLHNLGKISEAETLHRESLEEQRRVLGNDHLDTLKSINNVGVLLLEQGKLAEAEQLLREALDCSRRALGDDHPDTLHTINNLGVLLLKQGKISEAEVLCHGGLACSRRILGDDHPDTLNLIHNMGFLLKAQGKLFEAEPYYAEAIAGCLRLFGDDHPSTLSSIRGMGAMLRIQNRATEAEPYYQKALAGYRRVLGDDHPDTLISINNLGTLLFDQGKLTEAEQYYREALEGSNRVLGEEHSTTLQSINNLAVLVQAQGQLGEAKAYFLQALEGRRQLFGNDHPATLQSIHHLGSLLYLQDKYAEAEALWTEAAESFETARLWAGSGGLERVQFTTQRSPLKSLAICRARNGKPLPAWKALESDLARGLLDTLSTRYTRPLNPGERSRAENLIGQLSTIDERIGSLKKKEEEETGQAGAMAEQLRNERERLQAELVQFEAEMTSKYGVAAGEVYGLSRIQAQLTESSALLAWVDIEGDSHAGNPNGEHWACVVKKSGDPIWIRLPGSGPNRAWTEADDDLTQQVRAELRRWSSGPSAQQRRELINQLARQRITPVEPHLSDVHHLIVLPAGTMAGIPVEILTYEHTVSYAPSGTMYAWLRENAPVNERSSHGESGLLLALGDPALPKPVEPGSPVLVPPKHGVLVAKVVPESNAMRCGLRDGDVLLSYGGTKLGGPEELGPAIRQAQEEVEGQATESVNGSKDMSKIPVTVWRCGKILEVAVAPGKLGVRTAKQPAPDAILTQRRIDAIMASTRGATFDPIPHTRHEVEAIAVLFEGKAGETRDDESVEAALILVGPKASEQRLDAMALSGELEKYRYLHLATHGVMDDTIAMNSAMILSQDNLPDAFEQAVAGKEVYDGRLTAEQIVRTWKLDADLVTLSGCATGLGKESGGEGYLGFSQALFVAGARSLLLSLWKVDDRATMLLMTRFYENLLGKHEKVRSIPGRVYAPGIPFPKADALREAKIWLRQLTATQVKELYSSYRGQNIADVSLRPEDEAMSAGLHPYENPQYWAAFILIGNPD